MNQKRENMLNLALETDEAQRARTENLNVGFDAATATWELIVKYHGDLEGAVATVSQNIVVETLIAGYAILTVPENLVDAVSDLEQIEYLEMPKRFFYSQMQRIQDNECFATVTLGEPYLTGRGVLILVADSGIDWKRDVFKNRQGQTRIRYLWDQTLIPTEEMRPPEGFGMGVEFDAQRINEALQTTNPQEQFALLPSIDVSGHGTAVAGIAAGAEASAEYLGAAPEAELLIVKLGTPQAQGFPRTTELMRAVTWGLNKAQELQMPLVINLSFGNSYGAHDGSSLLERFLDNAAEIGRTVICVGSGNEGAAAGHVAGSVFADGSRERPRTVRVELAVAEYESNLRVQLWQNYSDEYRIYLIAPGGQRAELTAPIEGGKFTLNLEQTLILAFQGEPAPYAVAKELYLEFLPVGSGYISSGIWTIVLEPVRVVTGQYYLYLADSATRNAGTTFFEPTPEVTLTIPSTASKVITVGAYDEIYGSYADFSGRGYADADRTIGVVTAGLVKPDFVAPGVQIAAPDLYGGYAPVTGTSFATPIASGAAALLMEWGIVRGNDPFLYGEKVKAYLRAGARPLRGESQYPNARVGFGVLCVEDSLPV